jgi:hypothetical protein
MKREHTFTVGRFEVKGEYEAVFIQQDGSRGMPSEDLGRLELQAAIAVFSHAESINGDGLRFSRKAMGLRQPDSAALLDVDDSSPRLNPSPLAGKGWRAAPRP